MRITVAIPHYNAPIALDGLLEQLERDAFDDIIVLDDCSDNQAEVRTVAARHPAVTFVYGERNVGSGANRNRILAQNIEGIVWFLDCDMQLQHDQYADRLRTIFAEHPHALIGFALLAADGTPMQWNYGHEMNRAKDRIFAELRTGFEQGDPDAGQQLSEAQMDYPWVRGELPSEPRAVDWVAEGSFALSYELFAELGGYDTAFRYHEGQDLARRTRDAGHDVLIHPGICTRHLEINVTHERRQSDRLKAAWRYYRKHGTRNDGVK